MRHFGMFSGMGVFTLVCKMLGIETIGCSEVDKYAISVYKHHFPEVKNYGDARTIQPEQLPSFNILTAGFPCQAFSIAGKRKGLEDCRGTLFYEIARIASVKRPELLLLENVRGLLSHDRGRTFGLILSTLSDLGYILQWQVLNSKDFGVPQNRERVFIIGHLREKCFRQIFPLGESSQGIAESDGEGTQTQISPTVDSRVGRTVHYAPYVLKEITKNVSDAQRVYDSKGIAKTLKGDGGGQGAKTGLYAVDMKAVYEKSTRSNPIKKSKDVPTLDHNCNLAVTPCIRAEHHNTADIHFILRDGRDNRSCLRSGRTTEIGVKGRSIRRLTPLECERLMGLPDNWTKEPDISDTQRYKLCGNGVVVNVVREILRSLI